MWERATLVQGRGPSQSAYWEGGSATLNILRVRCQNAEEFREHYKDDQPNGGLFCPTTTELSPGTPVVVELVCKALPNRVLIRGTVISWRPALPRLRVRAGAVVEFDADEAPKRDFILETLGGARKPTPKRKHARIPLGWPAKLRVDSDLRAKRRRAAGDQRQRGAGALPGAAPAGHRRGAGGGSARQHGPHGAVGPRPLPRRPKPDGDQVHLPRGGRLAAAPGAGPTLQDLLRVECGTRKGPAPDSFRPTVAYTV